MNAPDCEGDRRYQVLPLLSLPLYFHFSVLPTWSGYMFPVRLTLREPLLELQFFHSKVGPQPARANFHEQPSLPRPEKVSSSTAVISYVISLPSLYRQTLLSPTARRGG